MFEFFFNCLCNWVTRASLPFVLVWILDQPSRPHYTLSKNVDHSIDWSKECIGVVLRGGLAVQLLSICCMSALEYPPHFVSNPRSCVDHAYLDQVSHRFNHSTHQIFIYYFLFLEFNVHTLRDKWKSWFTPTSKQVNLVIISHFLFLFKVYHLGSSLA